MYRFLVVCVLAFLVCEGQAKDQIYETFGADLIRYHFQREAEGLKIRVLGAGVDGPDQIVFVAFHANGDSGSYLIPPTLKQTGSATWLPFAADTLIIANASNGKSAPLIYQWDKNEWRPLAAKNDLVSIASAPAQLTLHIPNKLLGTSAQIPLAIYLKDLRTDGGRGRFYGAEDQSAVSGIGERVIHHYLIMESGKIGTQFLRAGRLMPNAEKIRIYQMSLYIVDGEKNFPETDEKTWDELQARGFTHIWLTNVPPPEAWADTFRSLADRLHSRKMKMLVSFDASQEGVDRALHTWQKLGADGFGVRVSLTASPEEWRQFITQARKRDPQAYFILENANDIPSEAITAWLDAGFDALHDLTAQQTVKAIYEKEASANDRDPKSRRLLVEDHTLQSMDPTLWAVPDERLYHAVAPLLFGLSRGPVMLVQNQDAESAVEQRDFYHRLLSILNQPAFREGDFYPLNPDNRENPNYGRIDNGESGRWLYSYLRYDPTTQQRFLVIVNLHPRETLHDLRVRLTRPAMQFLGWDDIAGSKIVPIMVRDSLGDMPAESANIQSTPAEMDVPGLPLKELPPLSAAYYELTHPTRLPTRNP